MTEYIKGTSQLVTHRLTFNRFPFYNIKDLNVIKLLIYFDTKTNHFCELLIFFLFRQYNNLNFHRLTAPLVDYPTQ